MGRNIYIDNIPLEEARKLFFERIHTFGAYSKSETISILESVGRIAAEAVFSKRSSPDYCAAAMDGILLFPDKIAEARENNPVYLKEGEDFRYINTGNPIDYKIGNAVLMIENLIREDNGQIKVYTNVKPWENIRPMGEDITQGELVIPKGQIIRPIDLGALISAGIKELAVVKKPTIAIIPTGDEVLDIFKEEYIPGRVVDSNSYVFKALVEEWGGKGTILPKSLDIEDELKKRVADAVENFDIVVIGAGSSAGSKDFSKKVVEELGEVIVHGIGIKPGKPTILGVIKNKPVLGIPGYPVSSYVAVENFLKPLLESYSKIKIRDQYVDAVLSRALTSSLKHKEFVRVSLAKIEGQLIATPLSRGAGMTMSLAKADGILEIDKNLEGISAGEKVRVKLLKPLDEIESYIVSVGSHDIVMDLIGDNVKLVSTHVGSFGGILSIKNRKTHIAPIHILDEESGEYNLHILKRYFPDGKVALIKGIKRVQGIVVKKGNPLNINSLEDLLKKDIRFVNRQRGSGTRILLDYLLKKGEIDPENIDGYDRECATHLEVGMAIKSHTADMGLAIQETAEILDLDFIPIRDEDYDFLVPVENLEDPKIKNFIEFLKSSYFQEKVLNLKGYKVEGSGTILKLES